MKIDLDTYIISDTHFGHDNIIKYCDRPESHNEIMWDNWVDIVKDEDQILHLGDVMWYKHDTTFAEGIYLKDYVKKLSGKKFLIKGNHDRKKNTFFEDLGFTVVPERMFYTREDMTILFTHYPEENFDFYWDINIHGHIHNNGWVKKEKNGRLFINVSVEVMDYMPIMLRDILKEV